MQHNSPDVSGSFDVSALLRRCTFPEADHVFCAVSGGADSLSLLYLARAAGKQVTAIHVDHGLREGSSNEADVVARAAVAFGALFISERVRVSDGPNLEARARAARYSVLPEGTLTGHTADDQAETVLLNLMRGSGLSGLAGMRPDTKPILRLRRSETRRLCETLGLAVVSDPSNDDPRFRRNRVRNEVLPLLNDVVERDVAQLIARQCESIREDTDLLDSLAKAIDPTDAKELAAAPPPLARRAIRMWLSQSLDDERHPPDSIAVERVLNVARGSATACDVIDGISVRRTNQILRVERR